MNELNPVIKKGSIILSVLEVVLMLTAIHQEMYGFAAMFLVLWYHSLYRGI